MSEMTDRTARSAGRGSSLSTGAALLLVVASFGAATPVSAQSAADRVNQMTAEAMEAYNNLEIDRAGTMLVETIEFANQNGVGGPPLARANMNLGIVYIGGVGDNANALVYLVAAVCADPSIQLDPLTSTPDIQAVFQQAQQRAQSGGCGAPAVGPGPSNNNVAALPPPVATDIIHTPPAEQREQVPLPLYLEASFPGVQKVQLYYKGLGMDAFKRVDMVPYGAGYAYQLSCQDIWPPRVVYYIAVVGDGGRVIASAGSAEAPIEVAVISGTPMSLPTLPDAPAPATCQARECPPGQVCPPPPGIGAIGEPCEGTNECQSGLTCNDSTCALAGAGSDPGDPGDNEPASTDFARFFLQFGGAIGFASVQAGMLTDAGPPPGSVQLSDVFTQGGSPWVADANSTSPTGMQAGPECPAFGRATAAGEWPDSYCANVSKAGFVSNTAIRASIGYFLAPWFSLAAIVRYQPDHGVGALAGMLVGGRAEIMLTDATATGLSMSIFAGGTSGTIHVKPPPKNAQWEPLAPYVISGLGGAHAGSNLRYRFARNVGVFLAPEVDVQFPLFMINIDVTAGLELAL